MKVTGKTIIGDIVNMGSEATKTLMSYGMACVGCPSSQRESLEEAASVHGLDLDELIKALNNM